MRRHTADQPLLITTARESKDEEFDRRRKRYAVMMALRALCVVGAAATYRVSMVLALIFILGGLVLPWCAVLIANDGPPRQRDARGAPPSAGHERALPPGESDDRTVDG